MGADGKAAGDFSLYKNKCDLFKAGWKLFRPEAYDFNLVVEGQAPADDPGASGAQDEECDEVKVEKKRDTECVEERRRLTMREMPPRNSEEAKRILNAIAHRELTTKSEVNYITLKKRSGDDCPKNPDRHAHDVSVRPFDDGLYYSFK